VIVMAAAVPVLTGLSAVLVELRIGITMLTVTAPPVSHRASQPIMSILHGQWWRARAALKGGI